MMNLKSKFGKIVLNLSLLILPLASFAKTGEEYIFEVYMISDEISDSSSGEINIHDPGKGHRIKPQCAYLIIGCDNKMALQTNGNKFTIDTYEVFEENGECRIIRTSDMNCFMELLLRQGGFLVVRLEGEDSIFNVYIERQV
ncbi:MAG: hypothetical protein K1W41_28765 [Lachnospiraceae bacterium]|jgi:hypothetical protein